MLERTQIQIIRPCETGVILCYCKESSASLVTCAKPLPLRSPLDVDYGSRTAGLSELVDIAATAHPGPTLSALRTPLFAETPFNNLCPVMSPVNTALESAYQSSASCRSVVCDLRA